MALVINAAIRGLGTIYIDGVERIEIHIPKNQADGLPYRIDDRVQVVLHIQDEFYDAGLRSTINNDYVWICPDVIGKDGKKKKLAHAIAAAGFKKNDHVLLVVNGKEIILKSAEER